MKIKEIQRYVVYYRVDFDSFPNFIVVTQLKGKVFSCGFGLSSVVSLPFVFSVCSSHAAETYN